MCPTVAEMGVQMEQVSSLCARWRILRCGDFATISQLWNECPGLKNGTCVPKGGFTAAKHPSKWRFGCKTEDFKAWRFCSHFAAAKQMYLAAKWHSCAMGSLRSCENFHRGGWEAAKPFRSGKPFLQRLTFAAKFRSPCSLLAFWDRLFCIPSIFLFNELSTLSILWLRWALMDFWAPTKSPMTLLRFTIAWSRFEACCGAWAGYLYWGGCGSQEKFGWSLQLEL